MHSRRQSMQRRPLRAAPRVAVGRHRPAVGRRRAGAHINNQADGMNASELEAVARGRRRHTACRQLRACVSARRRIRRWCLGLG